MILALVDSSESSNEEYPDEDLISDELLKSEGQSFGAGIFDTFRHTPFPTIYGPLKTPVTSDVLEAGFLFAFGIVAFSFLLILPGVIFKKRLLFFVKIVIGLFILISIFLCNFGQEWEVAEVEAKTQYKAGTSKTITADIGVKIGLRSVNITLKVAHGNGSDVVDFGTHKEKIDYNERFSWDNQGWTQGRAGFGPFAGRINQEFRAGQFKGLPYPILWIAEYFVPDGDGIRWGRFYRQAGYFTHIFIWLAFPLFILSMVLIMMVRSYGALFFILTGSSMIAGNLCFGLIRNPTQLQIPFEPHHLVFHWGWCFWLCLTTGAINLFIGFMALLLDCVFPDWLAEFLNIDVSKDYEEFFLSREELENLGITIPSNSQSNGVQNRASANSHHLAANEEIHGYRKHQTSLEQRLGSLRFKGATATHYKIINPYVSENKVKASKLQRSEKERPPLPKRFDGRQPSVFNTKMSFTNRASQSDSNYDNYRAEDMDMSHGLNTDPCKQDMPNYDNIKPKMNMYLSDYAITSHAEPDQEYGHQTDDSKARRNQSHPPLSMGMSVSDDDDDSDSHDYDNAGPPMGPPGPPGPSRPPRDHHY